MWLLVIGAVAFAAYTGMIWSKASENGVARERAAVAAVEARLQAKSDELKQEGVNHIADMVTVGEVEFAKGRAAGLRAQSQGAKYVAANPAFANPACNIGSDFVQLINSEGADMRAPGPAPVSNPSLPPAGTISGRPDADGSGANVAGPQSGGPLVGVPPKPRPIDRTGEVPR